MQKIFVKNACLIGSTGGSFVRLKKSTKRNFVILSLVAQMISGSFLILSWAQAPLPRDVQTDGSLGVATTLGGLDVTIPAALGKQMPASNSVNLFHSFARFNVQTGGSVTFTGSNTIENIISRVTGTQNSLIDGLLASSINNANLFLLNPNGVIFGPNASLDVSGSFYASTANFLRFDDDFEFQVANQNEPLLTAAQPSAFGFIGLSPPGLATGSQAAIKINGLNTQGTPVIVIGRDSTLQNSEDVLPGIEIHGPLLSQGGPVTLASVASDGVIPLNNATGVTLFDGNGNSLLSNLGQIEIGSNNSNIDTIIDLSGDSGESLFIRGGKLVMENASAKVATGNNAGGEINIKVSDFILKNGVSLETITTDSGTAGDIHIEAGTVEANIAEVDGNGNPVPLEFATTDRVKIASESTGIDLDNNEIINDLDDLATGDAGGITIKADKEIFASNTQIHTKALGEGGIGNINISTSNPPSKIIFIDSLISSQVNDISDGAATKPEPAAITISASTLNMMLMEHPSGNAGEVGIFNSTSGARDASKILLQASDTATFQGTTRNEGTPDETAILLPLLSRVPRTAQGNGGDIEIDVDGGRVNLDRLALSTTTTFEPEPDDPVPTQTGLGGGFTITAEEVMISQAAISSRTTGFSDAGDIQLHATESVTIQKSNIITSSIASETFPVLDSETEKTGTAGAFTVKAKSLAIDDSVIDSVTSGLGNGAEITFNVDALATNSLLPAKPDSVFPRVRISSSSTGQFGSPGSNDGKAGSVTIQGEGGSGTKVGDGTNGLGPLELTDTAISTEAQDNGEGGAILIASNSPTTFNNTTLSADVTNGTDAPGTSTGSIIVNAPTLTIAGGSLTAQTKGTRNAGDVVLSVGSVTTSQGTQPIPVEGTLTDRVQISSSSVGTETTGGAGSLSVVAEDFSSPVPGPIAFAQTDISTRSEGTGASGDIFVQGEQVVALTDTTISANVRNTTEGDTARAFIGLSAPDLQVRGGGITAQTTGSRGAGDVVLSVGSVTTSQGTQPIPVEGTLTDRVQISSSSVGTETTGGVGSISINGPDSTLENPTPVSGAIRLAETEVSTTSEGVGESGSIALAAFDGITLTNTSISGDVNNAATSEDTEGASIELRTSDLQITGGEITAQTIGSRDAGDVVLRVGTITTQDGTEISSSSLGPTTTGAAGSVTIEGPDSTLENPTPVSGAIRLAETEVSTTSEGVGESGSIALAAFDGITLTNTSISGDVNNAATSEDTEGASIELRTSDLQITGGGITAQTTGTRNAGDVVLQVGTMTSQPGANRVQISSSSLGDTTTGGAGSISIEGPGSTSDNQFPVPGSIALTATDVSTTSEGTGEGGSIALAAENGITLVNSFVSGDVNNVANSDDTDSASIEFLTSVLDLTGGAITAQTTGSRDAGDVVLKVASITTQGGTEISSSSVGTATTGAAGSVSIEGPDSTLTNQTPVPGAIQLTDTEVSTTSEGVGESGSIALLSETGITLADTTISANVANKPNDTTTGSSDIELTAPALLINGGGITAQSTGNQDAGSIRLNAETLMANVDSDGTPLPNDTRTTISSSSTTTGKAGSVTIKGLDSSTPLTTVTMNNTDISTTAEGTGGGGNITVNSSDEISLTQTTLAASVNNGQDPSIGATSDIVLQTPQKLMIQGGGLIAESTGTRRAGNINLTIGELQTDIGNREILVGNTLTDRVQIRSSSTGASTPENGQDGNAGNIRIDTSKGTNVPSLPVTGNITLAGTDIQTDADRNGAGGTIQLFSIGDNTFGDSTLSTNVTNIPAGQPDSAPAAIIVNTPADLSITESVITAQSTGSRAAGNIRLQGSNVFTQTTSVSSSTTGADTNVEEGHIDGNAGGVIIDALGSSQAESRIVRLQDTTIETSANRTTGQGGVIGVNAFSGDILLENSSLSSNVTNLPEPNASDNPASIIFNTSNFSMTGGSISAESNGQRSAGQIDFNVTNLTTFANADTSSPTRVRISSSSTGEFTPQHADGSEGVDGKAGNIELRGGLFGSKIDLADTDIETDAKGNGNGGAILLSVFPEVTLTHSTLSANVNNSSTDDKTSGANVTVLTRDLVIKGGGLTARTTGEKDAGAINLIVDTLTTSEGSQSIQVDGESRSRVLISSSSAGQNANGKAGDIMNEAFFLNRGAGAFQIEGTDITTESEGFGDGGRVILNTSEVLTLINSRISANVTNGDDQTSEATGSIMVTAPALSLVDGGITAQSTGTRNAGNITLNTDQLTTSATGTTRVEISSSSTSANSDAGNAGSITIEGLNSPVSGPISLTNTDITTEATSGQGGAILVDGAENTVLDSTTVSARVTAGGEGGNITIHGSQLNPRNPNFGNEQLLVRNGSTISAESTGTGNAGTINLATAGTLRVTDSNVTTEATRASGGNIKLNADFMIHILDSRIESSVEGDATTEGGNISIDPEFVLIQNSQILAQANQGAGGNIDLIGDVVLIDGLSTIDASSAFGVSGTVNITSPIQNLSGTIAPLPETIIQTATLYGQRCAAQKGSDFSSLNVRGRDRVPFEPGDYLLTPLILETPGENLSKQASPSSSPMVSRLGLTALDTQLTGIFTSFDQGVIRLGLFEGGCRS